MCRAREGLRRSEVRNWHVRRGRRLAVGYHIAVEVGKVW